MNCEQVQELLSPYIDNVLETDAEIAIARHLEMCGECSREHSQLVQLISMLKAMGDEELPEGFNDRLMGRLRSASRKRIWLPTWLPAGAAAAILVLLFLGTAPGVFQDDTLLMERERSAHMNTAVETKQVPSSRELKDRNPEKKEPVVSFGLAGEQNAPPGKQFKSGTDDLREKSFEPSGSSPQVSNRSNTGIRSRDEVYTAETFSGGPGDKAVTKKSDPQQPLPEADSLPAYTTFGYRSSKTVGPVLHLRVEDIDSVSIKLKAVVKSFGGTVRETGGENRFSEVTGSFQVFVPRPKLEQFIGSVSGLGEVVQDSVPRQSSFSTAPDLGELKKKREDLKNQILYTADILEVKALQQEIAQLDMEIEALESGSELKENNTAEINILLEKKGK